MSLRSAGRNNILAGLFLLAGIVLAVAVSVVLSGAADAFSRTKHYTVLFSMAEGAAGIKPGSMVLLGGQAIGKVRAVSFRSDAGPPGPRDIAVEIAVLGDFTFYTNAEFSLERPLLGSFSTINITDVGRPGDNGAVELPPGGSIRATLAPPSFLAQAGVGSEQVGQIQNIITAANRAATRFGDMLDRYEPKFDSIVGNADSAAQRIGERIPAWTDDVDQTLAGARKIGPLADDAALAVNEARDIIRKAGAIADDGAPKIAAILSETQSAAEKLNRESIDRFNTALDHAQAALEVLSRVGDEVGALLREESPNVRRIFANARLASEQLKLATVEVRSQPWRLLYTPTPKESETSVLYDAARNYAAAASDLRAAGESLEAVTGANSTPGGAPGAAQAADRQTVERLTAELERAFSDYRAAEKALLDILIKRGGESAPAGPK